MEGTDVSRREGAVGSRMLRAAAERQAAFFFPFFFLVCAFVLAAGAGARRREAPLEPPPVVDRGTPPTISCRYALAAWVVARRRLGENGLKETL